MNIEQCSLPWGHTHTRCRQTPGFSITHSVFMLRMARLDIIASVTAFLNCLNKCKKQCVKFILLYEHENMYTISIYHYHHLFVVLHLKINVQKKIAIYKNTFHTVFLSTNKYPSVKTHYSFYFHTYYSNIHVLHSIPNAYLCSLHFLVVICLALYMPFV